ncbi:hypothetical protein BMF94_2333 [Rhodotorula taiwanensis]|uniref:Uncharacterized protein n=1 Tax=Rhodotorula taiwanensis TaxID=741276 RepID=A0A2S5BCT1_9BASI|nr:hypothetical protein BMF94_2333 [Rhodotorula taiwanensis]
MAGSKQRPTANRSPSPKAGNGSDGDEEEEFDLEAFQAEIDASVQASRALVESWTPKNLGPQWQYAPQEETGERGLQQVKERARPPRLGLGATVASAHKQLAEDRKIRNQLLGKKRPAMGDAGSNVKSLTMATNGGSGGGDDDDDDEEESRSKAVGKGKGKANAAPNGLHGTKKDYSNPFVIPKATPSEPTAKAAVHAAADTGGKALFNDPSPAKPAASSATIANKSDKRPLVAASAFYGGSAAADPAASASSTALTKNQRKKERQREKAAQLKRQREEESRQEELAEQDRAKRARVESDKVGDKAADSEVSGSAAQADRDDDVDDAAGNVSMAASNPPSPAKEGQVGGSTGGASPAGKRKKKKKKKVAASSEAPLLNL